jgi:hypothetical protein
MAGSPRAIVPPSGRPPRSPESPTVVSECPDPGHGRVPFRRFAATEIAGVSVAGGSWSDARRPSQWQANGAAGTAEKAVDAE